ncbi:hemolysin III family protein [Clostridium sp. MSJ-8]|uniref:PAQR family membrane homeostasis protein TrhA n=1 Tax=Clostridium sp. MSJ-8 TaxID=2841510 RepID=UPI001C0E96B6|nr:hemolysin III family protein [Clostridium sp. MSJ-8]MBU5486750.1 hemolysin III family protein [Clostridium sp. MSJ-8]
MEKYLREPINGLTHFIGALLSVLGLVALIIKTSNLYSGSSLTYFSVIAFGIGMILLYSASATYHSILANNRVIKIFKKLDHSMIFVLIMCSYAPFCLIALNNRTGYILFAAVAIFCTLGIIFKLCWINCPKWLSSAMYIFIGWFAIFAIYPLSKVLSTAGLVLLLAGGVLYTIGGVIYAIKPDRIKLGAWGNHEIFHIFIMLGTLCHFFAVYSCIL